MEVKYSDVSNGYKYGEDGILLSNWDPNKDYGNEYVEVYFNIETPFYRYPFNDYSKEDLERFHQEAETVLGEFGFHKPEVPYTVGLVSGKERLHIHPQQISGEVLKNRVKQIAERFCDCETFSLRWVNLHKTYYDMTDEEYETLLAAKDSKIRNVILEKAVTKRKNLFVSLERMIEAIYKPFFVCRVGERNNDCGKDERSVKKHIEELVQQMVEENLLDSFSDERGMFIRTIKHKNK